MPKKPKLSKAEQALELAQAAMTLAQEARDEFKRNAATFDALMEKMAKTYAKNDRVLCDYIDDLQDRLYGQGDILMVLSDQISKGEEIHPVTQEELLKAANEHRTLRIRQYEEREAAKEKQLEALKEHVEKANKPLDEMTEDEMIAATEEASKEVAAGYPKSAQMFGGK